MESSTSGAVRAFSPEQREFFIRLSVVVLLVGGALVYSTLFRRWGYHEIAPQDLPNLIPEDIAAATVHWWDTTNNCCGPFPAIWPGLALLCAAPLSVSAIRRRVNARFWATATVLCTVFGAGTMLIAVNVFLFRGSVSDSGWAYKTDTLTMFLGFGGYGLMFLSALALRWLTGSRRGAQHAAISTESA